MQAKIYDHTIDVLRTISILAVLLIHTTTRELEVTHYDLIHQTSTLFLNQASRFAVPLFFLISGFVLELNYTEIKYITFLKKRLNKIFIPYLVWSFIYYFFIYRVHSSNFLSAILTGSASYQLYFIPALLVFYLLFPFIHKAYKLISNKFVFIIFFIIQIYLLNYDYQFHTSTLPYPVAVFSFNFFVFLSGIVISRNREKLTKILKWFWPIFLIGSIGAAYYIFNQGKTDYYLTYNFEAFYSQWRPSVLIYTFLVFGTIYFFPYKKIFQSNIVKALSSLSFFIFFIHVIILEGIWKYVYRNDLLFFGSVAFISIIVAYISHRSKTLSRITG